MFKFFPCISSLSITNKGGGQYQISIILRKVCKTNFCNIKYGLVEIPLLRNEVMSLAMNHVH